MVLWTWRCKAMLWNNNQNVNIYITCLLYYGRRLLRWVVPNIPTNVDIRFDKVYDLGYIPSRIDLRIGIVLLIAAVGSNVNRSIPTSYSYNNSEAQYLSDTNIGIRARYRRYKSMYRIHITLTTWACSVGCKMLR